jgi:hypothetical protein
MCDSGGSAPPFMASELDTVEWSASRLSRFTLGERANCTHYMGNWVGPRAGLYASFTPAGHYARKRMQKWRYSSTILDLGTRWR